MATHLNFSYPMNVTVAAGTPAQVDVPWVTTLPSIGPGSGTTNICVLQQQSGVYAPGLYALIQQRWQYGASYDVIEAGLTHAQTLDVYVDPTESITVAPESTVYNNGIESDTDTIPPTTGTQVELWVVVTPAAIGTPNYVLPVATRTTLGGVMVPLNGGLTVDTKGRVKSGMLSVAGRTGEVLLDVTDVANAASISDIPVVPGAGNPVSQVGTLAIAGNAPTYMRSDAAPALNTTIDVNWTGAHYFEKINVSTPVTTDDSTAAASTAFVHAVVQANSGTGGSLIIGADPTAKSGPAAVNGVAETFMRSDAAPAINQDADYVWAGTHSFSTAVSVPTVVTTDSSTAAASTAFVHAVVATISAPTVPTGANPSAKVGATAIDGVAETFMRSDAAPSIDEAAAYAWTGANSFTQISVPTAEVSDSSTVAASTAFVHSVVTSVQGATGANPTAKVGPTAVNGVAETFLRSDAAPPIDEAATYAWTGPHSFNGEVSVPTVTTLDSSTKAASTAFVNAFVLDGFTATGSISTAAQLVAGTNVTAPEVVCDSFAPLNTDSLSFAAGTKISMSGTEGIDMVAGPTAMITFSAGSVMAPTVTPVSDSSPRVANTAFVQSAIKAAAATSADPVALSGPIVVNGVAETFMRSDAAPAIDQGADYTWTGTHSFDVGLGVPTADVTDSSTKAASTAFVHAAAAENSGGFYHIELSYISDLKSGTIYLKTVIGKAVTFSAGTSGSYAFCDGAGTGTTTSFIIIKNGASIGTLTFAQHSNTGVVLFAADVTFQPGDVFEVESTTSIDKKIVGIYATFCGTFVGRVVTAASAVP
jgi:hypothetical protein